MEHLRDTALRAGSRSSGTGADDLPNANRLRVLLLCTLSIAVLGAYGLHHRRVTQPFDVTVAAGDVTGESYIIAAALKTVVERIHPQLRLTVRATGGTTESLRLLESGQATLAAAQADAPVGSTARLMANLHADAFQLMVRDGSGIRSFVDLRGRRVALGRSGGQFRSFLRVAAHFGLQEGDFRFVGEDDESADRALLDGAAEAAFRVRAVGNSAIEALMRGGSVRLVEIAQAAAMRIRWVAFEPSLIPMGAYLGNPPLPDRDLATVAVTRTLLAHRDTPDEVVRILTETLVERRHEIAQAIPDRHALARPLLAAVRAPDTERGLAPALHPGARQFYDKDKPSYLEENADLAALMLTVTLLLGSWSWQLRRWMAEKRKNRADEYVHRVVELMNRAQICLAPEALPTLREALFTLLMEAVIALDTDQLSVESFESFRGVWQIARDVIGERAAALAVAEATASLRVDKC